MYAFGWSRPNQTQHLKCRLPKLSLANTTRSARRATRRSRPTACRDRRARRSTSCYRSRARRGWHARQGPVPRRHRCGHPRGLRRAAALPRRAGRLRRPRQQGRRVSASAINHPSPRRVGVQRETSSLIRLAGGGSSPHVLRASPVASSHTRTVESHEPDATADPSAENATAVTQSV